MKTLQKTSNKGGRPTAVTAEVVAKLEEAFRLGCNIETACSHAGINKATYYRRLEADSDFATKMQGYQNYARLAAGSVVMQAIVKDKDVATARWWLEKKHSGEFSSVGVAVQNNIQMNVNLLDE